MPRLLVIDDEEAVRYSFNYVFTDDDVEVLGARTAEEGWQLVQSENPDVIVLDLQLPDQSGLELFARLQELDRTRPVIFITAHGTADTAIEAMKQGAFDYLVKPVELEHLSDLLERAFETARLRRTPIVLPDQGGVERIIGGSRVMQEMCKLIGRLAGQEVNVLILGESGTGKELVARALYQHSRRANQPFQAINCAAIPESLLESELFGHEQGAFTGAVRRRIGKFEQCDGGTLLLDEIGDMPPALQAKMLRILQDQQFERLGGNETLQTSVRILAATNQNLEHLVQEGRFRADLYYRLKVVTIQVPPLADRLDDIAELAHHFLFRFDRELKLDVRSFSPETLELLQNYSWPGNVRELQSVIKQAMLNASGHVLLPEFLPIHLCRPGMPLGESPSSELSELHDLVDQLLAEHKEGVYEHFQSAVDRVLLSRVMEHTRGHQGQASEILGISRATLRQKLRNLGLAVDKVVTQSGE